jgi:hypothetical protein
MKVLGYGRNAGMNQGGEAITLHVRQGGPSQPSLRGHR